MFMLAENCTFLCVICFAIWKYPCDSFVFMIQKSSNTHSLVNQWWKMRWILSIQQIYLITLFFIFATTFFLKHHNILKVRSSKKVQLLSLYCTLREKQLDLGFRIDWIQSEVFGASGQELHPQLLTHFQIHPKLIATWEVLIVPQRFPQRQTNVQNFSTQWQDSKTSGN